MKKILIIEDDENIRRLLQYDLKNAGFDISIAKDGNEAITKVDCESYDVILIDWMLPILSGLELVDRFRKQNVKSILIMLTAKDDEADVLDAFEAGVDDYVCKPFSPRVLIARIHSHLKHPSFKKTNTVKTVGAMQFFIDQRKIYIDSKPLEVSRKEYDLLLHFAYNANIVLSREQLLNDVWGFDYDGDTRIVDVHIFRLRKKLVNRSVSIQSIRGIGYILEIDM